MNELDRLRQDLQAGPDVPFGPPDLDAVMATGRRIRHRRAIAGATAGLVLVTVTGVVVAFGALGPGRGAPVAPAAPPPPSVAPSRLPVPPSATPGEDGEDTLPTGVQVPEGEIVFRIQAIHLDELPQIRFGLACAVRDASGTIGNLLITNETRGSDVALGFHAVYGPAVDEGVPVPQFGYYAGPATEITGSTPDGTTVAATLAEAGIGADRIVVFWFDPATTGGEQVTGLRALDSAGRELPAGGYTSGNG
ncbi:hypothetical protein J2S43_003351 [Catenuloplanes nepalensis]|uniref:Uncharacterized protein n=1 Tax=Catenuloplanes nepalensis TaxID=587533 RepID=A0ABT9MTY3_9ACTN|nr:hypothetical protein [Catenuloplanes nepalensis]MDP9794839.1 hypothetical protein [Catenuloplanes nepalensis]